jgi:hypothetical protein
MVMGWCRSEIDAATGINWNDEMTPLLFMGR